MNRLTLWSAQALPLDAFVAFLFDTQVAMSAIDWSLEAMCVGTRAGRERLVDANVLLEELEIHASTLDDSFRRFAPDHLAKLSNDRDGELRAEVFARRWDARDAATGAEVVPALVELEVVVGGESDRVRRVFDLWLDALARIAPVEGYAESTALRARAVHARWPAKVGWMTVVPRAASDLPALPPFVERRPLPSGDLLLVIGTEPLEDSEEDRSRFTRTWEVVAPALDRARASAPKPAVATLGYAPAPARARSAPPAPASPSPPAPVRLPAPDHEPSLRGQVERALALAIDLTRVDSVDQLLRAEGLSPEQWSLTVQAYAARMTLNPRLRDAVIALGGRASNALMAPAVALFATAETAFERAIHLALAIAAGTAPHEAALRVGLDATWEPAGRAFAERLVNDPELASRLLRARAALEGRGAAP